MSSHLPQVSLQNLLHTSAGTKRKHTPPSTMTTMTPPSTMTNIQGEGLPSPSHNVLTNPPEPYKVKAHNGIVESAKKWYIQLDLTSYQPDITTFRYEGANSTRWGNRPNEASTKKHAETMYKQLWNFIMMYGDYDSLLILPSPPPNNVISMTAKSIELFLLYKRQKAGTPLLDPSTQEPVNDIFGKPFVCDGTWRAPDSNKIFNAAIANLHTANNQKGVYHEACKDCLAIHENDQYKGCVRHSGCPLTQRSGDPTNATEYTNSKAEVQKKDANYEKKGSSQLIPADLRFLQSALLSSDTIFNLQLWVIIIISCRLFLRHDEFHDLSDVNFVSSLFAIFPDGIEHLGLWVCGKADKGVKKYLKVVTDREYPDLDAVSVLLVYLWLIGWKGGYLFPSSGEIRSQPDNGIYSTTICYTTTMNNIQHLASSALIERTNLKIGFATFRKTGYCLAIFGEANRDDLKKSARHSQYSKDSATYAKDAEGLYKQHLANPVPMNCVQKWSNIRVEAFGQSEVMSALQGSQTVEIGKLPEYYVREVLKIPKGHQYETNMLMLLHLAKAQATQTPSDSVEISSLMEEYRLPQEIEPKINKIIAKRVDQKIQAMMENGS